MKHSKREMVIALHGLAGGCWTNWLLVRRLAAEGYLVENIDYPSFRCSIPKLVDGLAERFRKTVHAAEVDAVHVVAYSMGGIVVRAMLNDHADLPIDRMVMIAPPNQGSPAATRMAKWFRWFCPAVHELRDRASSYVQRLPGGLSQDVGIIAGTYDRCVPVESTRLEAVQDIVEVPASHATLPFRRDVAAYCSNFLQYGQFAPADATASVPSGGLLPVR
ncbi:lipase family alpha/beta hydrolase [Maioricimonas rarisocia]|uniref:lipase family alpha/beta hydrolase n=1 Tax=Maioricimonas rarisocia TaxID=2528026 RepID=UPI0018D20EBE|nr:alpha/beta fold hydrolase [Maioricimonas rarisocia]